MVDAICADLPAWTAGPGAVRSQPLVTLGEPHLPRFA